VVYLPYIVGAVAVLYLLSREKRPQLQALPGCDHRGHARRIQEGYIMSGYIDPENVTCIQNQGVRLILSAYRLSDATKRALQQAGIRDVEVLMSSHFRHADTILRETWRYSPDEILIHCNHGADRTGNIIAFLLVMRHGWDPDDALYAVVNPATVDLQGLNSVLREFGFPGDKGPNSPGVGIYSLRPMGKSGGMKARSEGYRQMIRENLALIMANR
jgi:hypothetical protein